MFSNELKYLFLIIVIFIAACVETDIFLPALPDMINYFGVSEEAIQGLLVWNMVGICVSGPFYGPISDAIGRKKPLMVALGLFLIGSLLTLVADDYQMMLGGRLLQGIGSGGCFTLGTAVIFDAFSAERAVQALNKINAICPFIMATAPMLGGYLNHAFGFRYNFLAITLLVGASYIICQFYLSETLADDKRRPLDVRKITSDFWRTLTCIPFWQTTVIISLLFAVYLTFLSFTAVLFVLEMGVSKVQLPFYQGVLLATWLVASLLFKRSLILWGGANTKRVGMILVVLGALGFAAATVWVPRSPKVFTSVMILFTFGCNWMNGLYFPESMQLLPDIRGVTASVLTSVRLLITAVIIHVTSLFYDGTILPLAVMMGTVVMVIVPLVIAYERRQLQPIVD